MTVSSLLIFLVVAKSRGLPYSESHVLLSVEMLDDTLIKDELLQILSFGFIILQEFIAMGGGGGISLPACLPVSN